MINAPLPGDKEWAKEGSRRRGEIAEREGRPRKRGRKKQTQRENRRGDRDGRLNREMKDVEV